MPELPEVETICRSLAPYIVGKQLTDVEVRAPRLRRPLPSAAALRALAGQSVIRLERRAKYLLWHFDGGGAFIIHLGMSGRLIYNRLPQPPEPHTHVIFHFSDGGELHFRDPRRFGSLDLVAPGEMPDLTLLRDLGLEPLSPSFTPEFLQERLQSTQRAVKTVIMDQRVVVGVGNIYANEALFMAGIHPLRRGNSLSAQEAAVLQAAIIAVLQKAVERGGTTLSDFRNAAGEPGFFQLDLAVYGRNQEPCPRCGREIIRLVQGGRSSFFCETCQT
ncbi:MAG TPA: bifunctional DNA-formamidopyrimidine glycosylase/DNA-(apurinic or apyrimidinic site) lyase [bacterium]|mgnify:CR=1 FL=1|nr:bifunctional DNA-formamidopyrimidine glycosylase/DNA-(apurinic or apyrimidinic site) lyase [bacterium]HPR89735.1 bifunctional DNA-formamidopyrimidine glycosylase/DNA-(apurinic or apyrimidinic site) lyase [bacterium]